MENIKRVIKNLLEKTRAVFKKTIINVKRISWERFWKFIAIVLMIISGIVIFLETVIIFLFALDPEHLAKILFSKFDFELFNYINQIEYYSILFGGYFLDLVFWWLIIIFAIWLYNKKNIFSCIKTKILFLIIFVSGSMMFISGIYYALPEIKEPIKKIIVKHHEYKDKKMMHKRNYHFQNNKNKKYPSWKNMNGGEINLNNFESDFHREIEYFFYR